MCDYTLIHACQPNDWLDSQAIGKNAIGELGKKFGGGGQIFVGTQGTVIFVFVMFETEPHFVFTRISGEISDYHLTSMHNRGFRAVSQMGFCQPNKITNKVTK